MPEPDEAEDPLLEDDMSETMSDASAMPVGLDSSSMPASTCTD